MPTPGTQELYIAASVLDLPSDLVKQAVAQANALARKYTKHRLYMQASPTRQGDFACTFSKTKIDIEAAFILALPGKDKSPIITTVFDQT